MNDGNRVQNLKGLTIKCSNYLSLLTIIDYVTSLCSHGVSELVFDKESSNSKRLVNSTTLHPIRLQGFSLFVLMVPDFLYLCLQDCGYHLEQLKNT